MNPTRPRNKTLSGIAVAAVLAAGCRAPDPRQGAVVVAQPPPNLLRVTTNVWSGGAPEGDAAFAALAGLGVNTIVSVDGARPDIAAARRHGLRYVHVPIGYDGVGDHARLAFTRLAGESIGPLYFHCHHGKHRAPTAAAIVCLAGKELTPEEALAYMKRAGTGSDYAGLWRAVETFAPPAKDTPLPDLPETAPVDSLTGAMAALDRAWDELKLCWKADWRTPQDHPDIAADRSALLLQEGFHESVRALKPDCDPEMRDSLVQAEQTARSLRDSLGAGRADKAGLLFEEIDRSCKDCHKSRRN